MTTSPATLTGADFPPPPWTLPPAARHPVRHTAPWRFPDAGVSSVNIGDRGSGGAPITPCVETWNSGLGSPGLGHARVGGSALADTRWGSNAGIEARLDPYPDGMAASIGS